MPDDDETLELINLLNLPLATPIDERLWHWAQSFETWLEERRSEYLRTTAQTAHLAWREFLELAGKAPWSVFSIY